MWKGAGYVFLFTLLALALVLLQSEARAVEPFPDVSASADIEAGLTSNGAESPIGSSDFSLRQSYTLDAAGEGEGMALRGTLGFEQTRFSRETFEDDDALAVTLAAGRQLSSDWLLRGSLALRFETIGDDVAIAGLYLATRTLRREADAAVEAVYAAGETVMRFGLAYAGIAYGKAEFPDLPLSATKLQADLQSFSASAGWRRSLGAGAGFLAGLETQMVQVPEADQVQLGRYPSLRLRGSLGYEAAFGALRLAVAAGGDIVSGNGRGFLVPYGEARLTVPLGDRLSLQLSAAAGVNLIDAIDALASFDRRIGVDAELGLLSGLRLTASGTVLEREGVDIQAYRFREASLSIGFAGTLSAQWDWQAMLRRLRHREAGNDYDSNGFSLGFTGRI